MVTSHLLLLPCNPEKTKPDSDSPDELCTSGSPLWIIYKVNKCHLLACSGNKIIPRGSDAPGIWGPCIPKWWGLGNHFAQTQEMRGQ